MKVLLIILLLATVSNCYEIFRWQWEDWKAEYGKLYDPEEEAKRENIWNQNIKKIIEHNGEAEQGLHTYMLGMNQFADLDENEKRPRIHHFPLTAIQEGPCNATFSFLQDRMVPDAMDWRTKGAVTPVANQGKMGESWTYSATGSLEGQLVIKTGKIVKLSERNLVDCATAKFSPYCEAGGVDCAFYYVMKNNGIDTESGYPATPEPDGKCHYTPAARGATCSGCVDLPRGDEDALKTAVANVGPISALIDAGHTSFQLYKSGIYYEPACSSEQLDHAMLIVGYGTENGQDYWIVKNSWGTLWGEEGYVRMSRNRGNNCGIATMASYPTM